jgi:exodeoxyribonuclease VII large subunit
VNDLLRESPAASAISVSELNRQVRTLLERGIGRLWVDGEISNLARPGSGHLYFTLKDASAQVRCAWFRQRQRGPTLRIADGDRMLVYGRVSLYEARGDYQLIVEQVEPAGEGELRRRFEVLKKQLAAAGLFDPEHKRKLPPLPRCIGVVTSPSGAAIRDVLTVLRRRFPAIPVVIYPSPVQGATAVPGILEALATACRRRECDVLILARGGGSLEDLWAFNEEALARGIFDCDIPVVCGVGHEIDVTIADFVADVRAPTPSGAAELVVPDQSEWQRNFDALAARLAAQMRRHLENDFQALDWLSRRLNQCSPVTRLSQQSARLIELTRAMAGAMRHDFTRRGRALDWLAARLQARAPLARVHRQTSRLRELQGRLERAAVSAVERRRSRLGIAERALNAVSPLATLERGYAIVTDADSGRVVTDAAQVATGTVIGARLHRGRLRAKVEQTEPEPGD